jgi:hypothetical protein
MTTYVLVHGATAGGWVWRSIPSRLRAAGADVYTPTLTGLGERRHLFSPNITMGTHIEDVFNVLICEDLHEVILVGHSYGGKSLPVDGTETSDPRFTEHPLKTFFYPFHLNNEAAKTLPRTYIFCTEKDEMGIRGQGIVRSARRVKEAGWPYHELKTGHHPMWTMPRELTELLLSIA